jgi:glycosyltransferase involved in cell wall biosynthesis
MTELFIMDNSSISGGFMAQVLHLISSSGFFGAENVLVELARELRHSTFLPIIGVFDNLRNPHLEVAEEAQSHDLQVAMFPCTGRLDLKTVVSIRRYLKKQKVDIVHSHGYKSNLYALAASLGKKTSRITTCHNWLGESPKMRLYAHLDKFFLNRFDKVIAVSDALKQEILKYNIAPTKVLTIYNGIDIHRFDNHKKTQSIKKEFGINEGWKIIGAVGRVSEEKGLIHLANAAEIVIKENRQVLFLIVGDGPLKEYLEKKCNPEHMIFTGIRNDVPDMYRCMDIFVLPSLKEGLPMVLLEAMASRLPVVATRVGAIPSVVKDGETGLLIEPGNEEEIERALLHLLNNQALAKSIGQKGYRHVKKHFSSETMARAYLNVYRDLINKA